MGTHRHRLIGAAVGCAPSRRRGGGNVPTPTKEKDGSQAAPAAASPRNGRASSHKRKKKNRFTFERIHSSTSPSPSRRETTFSTNFPFSCLVCVHSIIKHRPPVFWGKSPIRLGEGWGEIRTFPGGCRPPAFPPTLILTTGAPTVCNSPDACPSSNKTEKAQLQKIRSGSACKTCAGGWKLYVTSTSLNFFGAR